MKISAIETLLLDEFSNVVFVRVVTDAGIVGLGETSWGPKAVAAWVHETAAPYLIGQDPLAIAHHWEALRGFVGFAGTGAEMRGRSAIDIALWDILGQVTGQPIFGLLGGASRDRIRSYNTCAGYRYVRTPPSGGALPTAIWGLGDAEGPYEDLNAFMTDAGALAQSLLAEGITAMKIWPFDPLAEATGGRYVPRDGLRRCLEPFQRIRDAVGDAIDVMVEFHGLWDLPCAVEIAHALAPFDPYWFEDPVRMDSLDALARYKAATPVRVTASETLATRWAFRDLINAGAVDVVMFDPVWAGGISECRNIAALAHAAHLPVAPHDCLGPVEFMAAVHLSIHLPNTLVQESVRAFWTGWYRELVTVVPEVVDGHIAAPGGAGLGTALRPEVFTRPDLTSQASS